MRNRFSTLASGILVVLISLISMDLSAQCTPSFVTSDVTIELDNTTGMADITTASLAGVINKVGPDCGDFIFYSGSPVDGQSGIVEPYILNCDSIGILTLWVVLDDSSDGPDDMFDVGTDYGPWQIMVTVQDNTEPNIDDSSGLTPDCGSSFMLTTGNDYTFAADAVVLGAASADDCQSTLSWNHPDFVDNCGWTGSANVVISFIAGTTPPNDPQSLPSDVTISAAQIADSSSALTSVAFYSSATGCSAETIVTYTVTDASGNSNSCSFTITVDDDETPDWDEVATESGLAAAMANEVDIVTTPMPFDPESMLITVTLDCNSPTFQADSIAAIGFVPLATDNCDPSVDVTSIDSSDAAVACTSYSPGYIYRSAYFEYRAEDNCMNALNGTGPDNRFRIQIDVVDLTSPTFVTVPEAIQSTGGTTDEQEFYADTLTLYVSDYDPTVCEIDLDSDPLLEVAASDCQSVTYDWEILTSLDPMGAPTVLLAGTTGGPDDNNADLIYPVGVHKIAYHATDACGLVSTYTFTLEIVDDVPPVIVDCPMNIDSVNVTDLCQNTILWVMPTATDACPGMISRFNLAFDPIGNPITVITLNPDTAFATFPVGVNLVLHIFEDEMGNLDTCSFTVTIHDTQFPILTCGGDMGINTICSTAQIPNYTGNIASIDENCPGYSIAQYPAVGTTLGTIFSPDAPMHGDTFHVSLIITDNGGNKDTCQFVVTLSDNDLPIPTVDPLPLISSADSLYLDCGSYMLCAPTALDCNGTLIYGTATISGASLDPNGCGPGVPGYLIDNPGNYAILWFYDDGLGNIATQTQQVNILPDITDPTLNCPADITIDADPGVCTATGISGLDMMEITPSVAPYLNVVDLPADGQMIDNCGIALVGWTLSTGPAGNDADAGQAEFLHGDNIVTYMAADAAGNTGTCSFTVTIEDNEDPTFTCSGNVAYVTGAGNDEFADDCAYTLPGGDLSLNPMMVMDNCPGPITVSHLITDNTLGASHTAPSASSLAGATFTLPPDGASASFTVTWTVTDANNNSSTCSFDITVTDGEVPTIECPALPLDRTTSEDGLGLYDCFYTASGGEFDPVMTSDNCAVATITNDFDGTSTLDGEFFPKGITPVLWTVSDTEGNTATCSISIEVTDDESPISPTPPVCPDNVVLPNIAGDCNNDVLWTRPYENDWVDNCDIPDSLLIVETISDPGVQAAINNNFPYDQNVANSMPQTSFPVGTTLIVYTATDKSGNSSTCSFTVTIQDIEAPTVICPSDQILGITCGQGQVQNYIPLVNQVSDNCSDYTITQKPAAGANLSSIPGLILADGEMFDVTITVTDNKPLGSSDSCTFKVTLDEVSVPVPDIAGANLPAAFSECNVITIAAPTAKECGNTIYGIPSQGTLVNVSPPVYQYGIGNYFITWTYVGANGSVQQSQQITVLEDLTPPNALCKPVNVNLSSTNPGSVTVSAIAFNNGSTDNCSIVGDSYSVDAGAYSASKMFGCVDVGDHPVSLEVLDFNGNKGYCNTTLTINDITPPTIIGGCPSNLSFNTSNDGGYDCSGLATILVPDVSDNCDIPIYQLLLDGPNGFMVSNALGNPIILVDLLKGVTLATFAVTDEHGLQSTCSFSITIVDDEFPVISCAASDTRYTSQDGLGDCEYTINGNEFDPVSFDDNCPGATIINNLNGTSSLAGEILTTGVYPVTWTVADAVGHTTTCTLEITIIDDEAPIINHCQANKTQNVTAGTCNALVTWAPTYGVGTGHVMDNCGINTITQAISDPDVIPVYPYNQDGPYPPFLINQALFPIGITTISYTVTDINGNSSVCSFEIEVIDNIAPTVTCPPNQIMNTICADGTVQDYLGLIQNVSDNCAGNLVYTQSPAEGTPLSSVPGLTPADGESFTVTITVTDPNPLGLSGNCSFSVTLDDVNLPIPDLAQLPKDSTDCNVLVLSPPTANDCGVIIDGIPDKGNQISFVPPLYEFTTGLYTVIWTYVGTNGSVQQTQQIIVEDDLVPPVMDCDDITINLDANGNASITPNQIDGGTKDNCGIANLSVSQTAFDCSDVGVNIVVLTATDIHGNSNTCSANVTVKDVTIPTFNISNSTITVNCQSVPGVGNVLATDACGILTNVLTETSTKGLNANNCNYYTYTITRKWTATDVNNNVAMVQQVINVVDNTAPVWTTAMPDTIFGVTNQFDCKGQIFLVVDAFKVTDNCAEFNNLTITYTGTNGSSGSKVASGQYPIGKTTLTFIAIDPCGNQAVKQVVIIIEDKTPPTAVCVNSITLPLNPQGNLVIPPFIVDNGSYDNCLTPFSTNEVTLAVMPDTFDCDDAGKTFTITLTVTDLAGNTSTCPATLTVIDNTIPTLISCAPDVTVDCQDAMDPLVLGFPTVSDACGTSFNFTDSKVFVGGGICYNIIRSWSIIDGSGNNLNCTQTISVTDNQAPTFTSVFPADITIACGLTVPTPPTVSATDNCGTPVSVAITENSTQTNNNTCTDYAYIVTRTWTATDECGNATFHTQTITVVDIQAPVIFGLPDSLTLFTNDFNADSCTVPVTLQAQFIDCQDPGDITVVNNSPVGSGGSSASGKYSADQLYTITFTATDLCGNSSQKVVKVRVIDNSIPNAYCIAQVNVTLNSDGLAVITPVQIDDVSKDNCTDQMMLDFELSKDSFDCKNLGVNIVQMTVTDEQGNSNTCSASINVSADPALTINTTVTVTPETFMNANDGAINVAVSGGSGQFTYLWTPGNAITPSISNLGSGIYTLMITDVNTGCMKTINVFVQIAGVPFDTISGRIITPKNIPVARVHVNMTGSQSGTYYTGPDGYYEFVVPSGSTVTIRPFKDTLPANGVTALDFSIIQQHILAPPNLKPLTTPYQIIAADENGNNQINGIDIAQFNFTILNNKDTFPHVDSWVFVDSTFIFPMPTQPWATGWDDEITYPVISGNKPNSTFIAVKMGDVNGDVNVLKLVDPSSGKTRGDDDLILTVQDQVLSAGSQIVVPVTSENFHQILAYQFAWGFDPEILEFTGATGQALAGLSSGNFGTQGLRSGLLTHLWASNAALDVDSDSPLFTMYFNVLKGGLHLEDVLQLTNSYMGEIAYTSPNVPNGIVLAVKPIADTPATGFALLGNRPNPFSDQTLITFTLPENAEVKLTVLDITGQPVLVRKTQGVAGMNTIPVHQSEITAPGLYHYILESNGSRVLGKMIHQD
ncbi:MAG: HYR domain-containing protein [Saprospiraceae bacterium]|nr:HYR domain-containing protein [Saprospiraceae bacterium]